MFFDNAIHSFEDARRIAKRRLPWMVFDYIDGTAGTGCGARTNRAALDGIKLQPRVLNNVEERSIAGQVFGSTTKVPFGIAPMGMCNLSSPSADRLLARMAAKDTIPVGVSTVASTSLEEMWELSQGSAWFQLYISRTTETADRLIARAKAAGYDTLVLTVDVPEVGRRPRELRRGFKMPFRIGPRQFVDFACHPAWSLPQLVKGKPQMGNFGGAFGEFDREESRAGADWVTLARVRDQWFGKLVLKGVMDARDAKRAQECGVDAVQVSSHGSRQLDSAPPAIQALKTIRDELGPEFPLFYDSGIQSGEDIVKAYAMGADFVFAGRPFSYGIAANGATGLRQMRDVLAQEISITLAQLGLRKLKQITREVIASPL
ncbi:alpha-hydroxy acid oxidase [Neptunicoccus cionae]|uniref:Lactate dehydrogenase n=1 Tax=Neptunicoccus cionae TaxID=2035344 RepID=A0A916R1E6_9RHOB|nr:alpha-hydroxy acid oxidase [Amylibacter cionae]GGA26978.1 lactate dehydrogenase [Amylibacter cionae]